MMNTIEAMYVTTESHSHKTTVNSTQSIKLVPSDEEMQTFFRYGSHISARIYCKFHRMYDDLVRSLRERLPFKILEFPGFDICAVDRR